MHVYIVSVRRHLKKEENYREFIRLYQAAVCLPDSMADEFIPDESPVEKHVLKFVVGSPLGGPAQKGKNRDALFFAFKFNQIIGDRCPYQLGDSVSDTAASDKGVQPFAVVYQGHIQPAMS